MAGLDKIISQIKEESQEAAARTLAGMRQIRSWQLPVRKRKASALTLKGVPGSPLPTSWKGGSPLPTLRNAEVSWPRSRS